MKGGNKQVNTDITREQAVMHMLIPKSIYTISELSVISTDSLYGFVLLLHYVPVEPDIYEFLDMNDKPVNYFIIKIVVTCPEDRVELPHFTNTNGDNIDKHTQPKSAVIKEGEDQQNFFLATVSPLNRPITPSVYCTASYNNDESVELLYSLIGVRWIDAGIHAVTRWISKENPRHFIQPDAMKVLEYLRNRMTDQAPITGERPFGLSIIVMDYVGNCETVKDYILTTTTNLPPNNNINPSVIASCIALLIILLIVCKSINLDCHKGNILTNGGTTDSGICEILSMLIDFGKTIDLITLNLQPDSYTYTNYKDKYNSLYGEGQFEADLDFILVFNINSLFTGETVQNIRRLLRFMSTIDFITNINYGRNYPQMTDFINYYFGFDTDFAWVIYNKKTKQKVVSPPVQFLNLNSKITDYENDMCGLVCRYIQCVTEITGRKRAPLSKKTLEELIQEGVLNVPGSSANKNPSNKPGKYASSLRKYLAKFTPAKPTPAKPTPAKPTPAKLTPAKPTPKKGGKTHKNRTKRNHRVKRKNKTIKSKTSKTRGS